MLIKLDDLIGNNEFILKYFKNISPNIITLVGIVSNLIIYYLIKNQYIFLGNILLIFRCLCDIMDGIVARRYKKTSALGGYLDTLNDFIITIIYSYIIGNYFINDRRIFYSFVTLVGSIYMYIMRNSLSDHSNIKQPSNNITDKIITFFANNSIITYLLLISFNNAYLKKID
tara:strand:- start:221 stop:736 length:516 start_codon:yes stop_codon:yes gene_type:complete